MTSMQLKTKLFALVIMAALSLGIFGATSYFLRADSGLAEHTRIYDDVNADAVLPDLNVVKAHIPVAGMLMTNDPQKIQALAQQIKTEEAAYDAAEKDVLARLPDGKVKAQIQGKTHQLAMQYY